MKQIAKQPILACLLAALPLLATAAPVYECTIGGVTVYTSKRAGACRSPDLPQIGRYTSAPAPRVSQDELAAATGAAKPAAAAAKPAAARSSAPIRSAPSYQQAALQQSVPAPAATPKTSSGRRSILEQELANERKALASEQNELSVARAQGNHARAVQLANGLQDRQQNIRALQAELSRM